MQSIKWLAILTAVIVIAACFFPWISVDQNFFAGGFYSSENSQYGQPGLFHVIFCSLYILLLLLNKLWSFKTAFFVSAFNVAWAVRNFFVLSMCSGGVCPEKHIALYVVLIGSLLLIVLTSIVKVKTNK